MKRIRLIDLEGNEAGNFDIPPEGTPHPAVFIRGQLFTLVHVEGQDAPAVRTYRECEPFNVEKYREATDDQPATQQQRQPAPQAQQVKPPAGAEGQGGGAAGADDDDEEAENEKHEAALEQAIEASKTADADGLAAIDKDLREALAACKNPQDYLPLWTAAFDSRTAELSAPPPTKEETLASMASATSKAQLREIADRAKVDLTGVPDKMDDLRAAIKAAVDPAE